MIRLNQLRRLRFLLLVGLVASVAATVGCFSSSAESAAQQEESHADDGHDDDHGDEDDDGHEDDHGDEDEHDHDHAHIIPEHKPDTFPEAIEQLSLRTSARSPRDAASVQELRDIIGWLPELAAQTDLPRGDWEQIYAITLKLQQLNWNSASTFASPELAADLQILAELADKAKQVDTFNTYTLKGNDNV